MSASWTVAPATWSVAGSPGWRDGWYSHVASGGGADRCQAIAIGRTSALPSGVTTSMWVADLPFASSQARRLSMAVMAFEISPARCGDAPRRDVRGDAVLGRRPPGPEARETIVEPVVRSCRVAGIACGQRSEPAGALFDGGEHAYCIGAGPTISRPSIITFLCDEHTSTEMAEAPGLRSSLNLRMRINR